jgi:hypothetical protein
VLIRKRIHEDSLACLQSDGKTPHLFTHLHTMHDYRPEPDPIIAHMASKMVQNEGKMQFYLVQENSPTLTFKDALNND